MRGSAAKDLLLFSAQRVLCRPYGTLPVLVHTFPGLTPWALLFRPLRGLSAIANQNCVLSTPTAGVGRADQALAHILSSEEVCLTPRPDAHPTSTTACEPPTTKVCSASARAQLRNAAPCGNFVTQKRFHRCRKQRFLPAWIAKKRKFICGLTGKGSHNTSPSLWTAMGVGPTAGICHVWLATVPG